MKKLIIFLKVFISLILFLTLSTTILNIVPFSLGKIKKENSFRVKKDYPLIIPHGGAKMLVPENTIYAYDMLVNEYSVDVLEIDLVLTKDNILISHHDLDLGLSSEVLNDNKYIRDYTYSEILDLLFPHFRNIHYFYNHFVFLLSAIYLLMNIWYFLFKFSTKFRDKK